MATACRDGQMLTGAAEAVATQLDDAWVMTVAAPSESAAKGPASRATNFDRSPAGTALAAGIRHFGATRSRLYKTCNSVLPDGRTVSAVLSSPDEGGLRGEGKTVRLALFVSGVPRMTIEYSKRHSGAEWIVDAARYTLRDAAGHQVAHGMFQRHGSSLASLVRRWRSGGIADATTVVSLATGRSPAAVPANLTDSEIASIYCAPELAAASAAAAAAASYTYMFLLKSGSCVNSLSAAVLAAWGGDYSAALPADVGIFADCAAAKEAYGPMAFWGEQVSMTAAALTSCIAAHASVTRILRDWWNPSEGGGSGEECTDWSVGWYDDNWDWVEEDHWTDCNMT